MECKECKLSTNKFRVRYINNKELVVFRKICVVCERKNNRLYKLQSKLKTNGNLSISRTLSRANK